MFRVQGTFEEPEIDEAGVVIKDDLGHFWVFGSNEEEALVNAQTVLKAEEIQVTRVGVFPIRFLFSFLIVFPRNFQTDQSAFEFLLMF